MDIQTKDGILLRNIPDGTPDEAIKARIAQIRSGAQPKPSPMPEPAFEREARETKPTMGEELARQALLTGRYGLEAFGGGGLANQMGLPEPQGMQERIVGDTVRTMAGGAGITSAANALKNKVLPWAQPYMEMFASKPLAMQASAMGGGASSSAAKEGGAGPMGQMAAGLAGGIAPAAATGIAKAAGGKLADIGSTIGASFGNQRGIERIGRDAAQRVAGPTRGEQLVALLQAKDYAPRAKPNVAEALAEAQMGQPTQMGGATIKLQKDLSGAKGVEDVLPSAARQQRVALAEHLRNVKTQTKPMREEALAQANLGGVKVNNINAEIDAVMAKPGNKADDLIQKTLGAVKTKITELADDAGNIDARELYTVRKKLGNTIATFSKETANWDKKQTAGLEREVQKLIDDAIESAGGTGWRDYLKTYSEGMKTAERQKVAGREAKLIAAGIKGSNAQDLAAGELPKPPTLLSRPMMATNYLLKMLSRDANTPVAKYMAEQMRDPKAYAELLKGEAGKTPMMSPLPKSDAARRALIAAMLSQEGASQ